MTGREDLSRARIPFDPGQTSFPEGREIANRPTFSASSVTARKIPVPSKTLLPRHPDSA
jgi:hypothetical protein